MRSVRLRVQHGNCMPGDVVGYSDELAERLLARGLAEPVMPQPVLHINATLPEPPAAAVMSSPAPGRAGRRRP